MTAILALLLGFVIGFVWGEHYGTADTERRWSDAVGRAKDRGSR